MKGKVKDALLHFKRRPFALQKMPFWDAKGHVLRCKRAPIDLQGIIYHYKTHTPSFCSHCKMTILKAES